MHKTVLSFTILAALIFIYSCKYSPTSENYIDIEKAPDFSFELSGTSADTIPIPNVLDFKYDLTKTNRRIYKAQFFIDSELIHTVKNLKGDFRFQTLGYDTGFYSLELRATTSSGTNSLADQTGNEIETYNKRWTLQIDTDPPDTLSIFRAGYNKERKGISLEWEKYDRINFLSYKIYKEMKNNSRWKLVKEIFNPNLTELEDSTYMGNQVNYIVEINAVSKFRNSSSFSKPFPVNGIQPKLYKPVNKINSLIVSWDKFKYDSSFGSYQVSLNSEGNYIDKLFYSEDISDTTISVKDVPFGSEFNLTLNTTNQYTNEIILAETSGAFGELIEGFPSGGRNIFYKEISNTFYVTLENYSGSYIRTFSFDNSHVTKRSRAKKSASLSDSFILSYNNGFESKLDLYDIETFNFAKTIDFKSKLGLSNGAISRIASNIDGDLILVDITTNDENGFVSLFNLKDEIELERFSYDYSSSSTQKGYSSWNRVSKNGKYVHFRSNIYKNINGYYEILYTSPDEKWISDMVLSPDESSKIALVEHIPAGGQVGNTDYKTILKIFTLSDFSLISEKKLDGRHDLIYNNATMNRFLLKSYRTIKVLDDQGNILSEIRTSPSAVEFDGKYLVGANGYKLALEL